MNWSIQQTRVWCSTGEQSSLKTQLTSQLFVAQTREGLILLSNVKGGWGNMLTPYQEKHKAFTHKVLMFCALVFNFIYCIVYCEQQISYLHVDLEHISHRLDTLQLYFTFQQPIIFHILIMLQTRGRKCRFTSIEKACGHFSIIILLGSKGGKILSVKERALTQAALTSIELQ